MKKGTKQGTARTREHRQALQQSHRKRGKGSESFVVLLIAMLLVASMVPALAFATAKEELAVHTNGPEAEDPDAEDPDATDNDEATDRLSTSNTGAIEQSDDPSEDFEGALATVMTISDSGEESAAGMVPLSRNFSPFGASGDISGLSVQAAPTSFQTFVDIATGNLPTPKLQVGITVSISTSYTTGGRIELPLDYTPSSASHPGMTFGTNSSNGVGTGSAPSFFSLDTAALDAWILTPANTVVDSYSLATSPDRLIISLKSDLGQGDYTFFMDFLYNTEWNQLIPGGATMWEVKAEAYVDTAFSAAATPVEVASNARLMTFTHTYNDPGSSGEYGFGSIDFNAIVTYHYYYSTRMDAGYTQRIWFDLPTGSIPNSAITNYYNVPAQINIDGSGYDRYERNITPLSAPYPTAGNPNGDWNLYRYNGSISQCSNRVSNASFVPPPGLLDGETFYVRYGADYKQVNGLPQQPTMSSAYTKMAAARPMWDMLLNGYHANMSNSTEPVVCGLTPGTATTLRAGIAAHTSLANLTNSTRNVGAGPVTGVVYELYQAAPGSEKLNYERVYIGALRSNPDESGTYAWSHWRIDFVIKDAVTGATRTESRTFVPSNTSTLHPISYYHPVARTGSQIAYSATMGPNEYIDIVRAVPMGVSGTEEGVLPAGNYLSIRYQLRAWDDYKWPDGTAIASNLNRVDMAWRLYYDDCPPTVRQTGYPADYATNAAYDSYRGQLFQGNILTCYYTGDPYAQGRLTSDNPNAVPGGLVTYKLLGYNSEDHGMGPWIQPRMLFRVPDGMSLTVGGSEVGASPVTIFGALKDVTTGNTYNVTVRKTTNILNYNYYEVVAADIYNCPTFTHNQYAFEIPLTFRISPTMAPGSYNTIGPVLVTSGDASTFSNSGLALNGTHSGITLANIMSRYGFAASDYWHVTSGMASMALTVLNATSIRGEVTVASQGGPFVTATTVPVANSQSAQIKLTLTNNGNANLTNIRLYNILPYSGDPLGSNGSVTFSGVTTSGSGSTPTPTIKFTTEAVGSPSLPTYGGHGGGTSLNLQTATFHDGWTVGVPTSLATGIYLQYPSTFILVPGASVDVILTFAIPASGSQTAYDQFYYSYTETAQSYNVFSPVKGFSTEAISITYDSNLPAIYAATGALSANAASALTGFPTDQSAILGVNGEGTGFDQLTVAPAPSLVGFTFSGWYTAPTGGTNWSPGSIKTFTSSDQLLELHAQWLVKNITATFYLNYHASDMTTYPAGTQSRQFGTTLTRPVDPTRTGYTFNGWSLLRSGGSSWDFINQVISTEDFDLYAHWSPTVTTIIYNGNNPTSGMMSNSQATYGQSTSLTTNAYQKNGYSFEGWAISLDAASAGTVTYTNSQTISPWNIEATSLTLYAVWKPIYWHLTYSVNLPVGSVQPATAIVLPTAQDITIVSASAAVGSPLGVPLRSDGSGYYAFSGWNTQANGGGTSYSASQTISPQTSGTTLTLYAQWTFALNTYTVTFLDWNGTVLKTHAGISHGGSAVAPASPSRSGHTFTGWDRSFTNVTSNFSVTALYSALPPIEPETTFYTVTFVDWNGAVLAARTNIPYGGSAIAPASPTRTGYTFTGWDRSFGYITSNLTVAALYEQIIIPSEKPFTVRFVDGDGRLIKTEQVPRGGSATAPAAPTRTNYVFLGWDRGFTDVQSDITVTAQYDFEPITGGVNPPLSSGPGFPVLNIFGFEIPLYGNKENSWSLFNLICTFLSVLFLLIGAARFFLFRKKDDSAEERDLYAQNTETYEHKETAIHRRTSMLILLLVAAVSAVILFILTQDMSLTMVLFDLWSVFFALALILAIVSLSMVVRKKKITGAYEAQSDLV